MRSFLLLLFLIFQAGLFAENQTGTLHVVIVANIQDILIGGNSDAERMKTSFQVIGKKIGFQVNVIEVQGNNFTDSAVTQALVNLPKRTEDIIVFYYTGHGFNNKQAKSRWPTLCTYSGKTGTCVAGSSVVRYLEHRVERAAIILFDCCNKPSKSEHIVQSIRSNDMERALKNKDDLTGLTKLFLNTRGLVIAAAARPGEVAYGNLVQGGVFTSSFLKTLRRKGADSNITWSDILRSTCKLTQSMERKQHPIYDIR
jgi:hypothetical protein